MAIEKPMPAKIPCDGKKVDLPNKEYVVDDVVVALGRAGTIFSMEYSGAPVDMNEITPLTIYYPFLVSWNLNCECILASWS